MRTWGLAAVLLRLHQFSGAVGIGDSSLVSDNSGTSPAAVVIMAQARSGSTMLGELFRANEV